MSKRSAVEVLLSIEAKVDKVYAQQQVLDTNFKLLLNRLNLKNFHEQIEKPASNVVERENKARQPKSNEVSSKPVTIQQRIVYDQDQRPVILADVKIFNNDTGTLIKHTRTNASGFWDAKLAPAKYRVEVKKGPNATKPGFLKKYEIDITGDGGSQELERKLV